MGMMMTEEGRKKCCDDDDDSWKCVDMFHHQCVMEEDI